MFEFIPVLLPTANFILALETGIKAHVHFGTA